MSTILPPDAFLGTLRADELINLYDRAIMDGGFTVAVTDAGHLLPVTSGYAVTLPPDGEPNDPVPLDAGFADFAITIEILHGLRPDAVIGGWLGGEDGDELFVDWTDVVTDRATAERLGRERDQVAIFDLSTGSEIRL